MCELKFPLQVFLFLTFCYISWRCVSWNLCLNHMEQLQTVTSRGDVWVEIVIQLSSLLSPIVTSRGDVWVEIWVRFTQRFHGCVTSRGDVWVEIPFSFPDTSGVFVTSRRDMWVEMSVGLRHNTDLLSHISWRCVSWNIIPAAVFGRCVGWNWRLRLPHPCELLTSPRDV